MEMSHPARQPGGRPTAAPRSRHPGARHAGLVLCLAAVVSLAGAAGEPHDPRARELARLRAQIQGLQARIQHTREQRDDFQRRLRETEKRIGALTRRLQETRRRLARDRRALDRLNRERADGRQRLEAQRHALSAQVRAAYAMGQQQYLKLLLNQEDPAALGRALTYYDYLNRARAQRIAGIQKTLTHLAGIQDKIRQRTRELEALRAAQLADREALVRSRSARAQVLADLDRKVAGQTREIERLRRDADYLVRLIRGLTLYLDELRADRPLTQRFEQLRGKLELPARADLLARFGDPKQGELKWEGLFLAAPAGRQVHAVYRGRVAFADWFGGLGLLIIIDHGDGYMSLYGHNQALYAEVGDWVETGQTISVVGDSGGLDRPGLYFEIRHQGVPRNPLLWVRAG